MLEEGANISDATTVIVCVDADSFAKIFLNDGGKCLSTGRSSILKVRLAVMVQ